MSRIQYAGVILTIVCAGLIGGMVRAQPAAPKVVEAQSFVLVDQAGNKRGELAIDRSGQPNLKLYDARGRVVWTAMGAAIIPVH